MKVAFYSTQQYDRESFQGANKKTGEPLEMTFLRPKLDQSTASLAEGHEAVCLFVNDDASGEVLERLAEKGIKYITLRCAGTNNVDLKKAKELGLQVKNVPSYSPHAVAEFTVGMILTTIRKYHKAYNRVREGDFRLSGLVGFNLNGKTVGLIGTGRIGMLTGKIMSRGFGCNVVAYDLYPNEQEAKEYGITYVKSLDELLQQSDIVSLHCPLTESTYHILNDKTFGLMKKGAVLVNASRGGLVDTKALIRVLKTGHVGAVGLDVYEGESAYFFSDNSSKVIEDDDLARLISFHNVVVSGHQAFLTDEALANIAETTIKNLLALEKGGEEGVQSGK